MYTTLLRFAAERCQQFSLVWRDQLRFNPSAQEIAAALEPFLVAQVHTDTWPGTCLIGHQAVVRYYQVNRKSIAALQKADGLYSWLAPGLPEALAFYSSEAVLWLASISHEADAWFAERSLSRAEIVPNVPGIVLRSSA